MSRTVYVDVLFCLNFVVDYLILLSVQKFLKLSVRRWRIVCGASVGALSSFVIFLPPMPTFLSILINFGTAIVTVLSVLVPIKTITFIKATVSFFIVGFCFCGVCIALWLIFYPQNMLIRNGAVYIDISPFVLLLSTAICYSVMRLFVRLSGRDLCRIKRCTVTVNICGVERQFNGTVDTGNTLREPFSDEAVIVVRQSLFEDIIPLNVLTADTISERKYHFRFVPYQSVGGSGIIPAVKPEHIEVSFNGKQMQVQAYLAFCSSSQLPESIQALIPAEIISKEC